MNIINCAYPRGPWWQIKKLGDFYITRVSSGTGTFRVAFVNNKVLHLHISKLTLWSWGLGGRMAFFWLGVKGFFIIRVGLSFLLGLLLREHLWGCLGRIIRNLLLMLMLLRGGMNRLHEHFLFGLFRCMRCLIFDPVSFILMPCMECGNISNIKFKIKIVMAYSSAIIAIWRNSIVFNWLPESWDIITTFQPNLTG